MAGGTAAGAGRARDEDGQQDLAAEILQGEPPSAEELAAEEAAEAAKGDWGPVFVYGSMLFPTAWSDLLGRLPEMRSATLRGYRRRGFIAGGFAGVYEEEGASVVGMIVGGLLPRERCLLDGVVDDSFVLVDAVVESTGDADPRVVVAGCGSTSFNGRYLPDGVIGGRTCYRGEAGECKQTIHFCEDFWYFCEDYKGGPWYKASWDGKYPPLDGWEVDAEGMPPEPELQKEAATTECSMYGVRESCLDALDDEDWDFETFAETCLDGFTGLCRDTRTTQTDKKLAFEDLKELALARRRRQTGFEDEEAESNFAARRMSRRNSDEDLDAIDPRLGVQFPQGIIRLRRILDVAHMRDPSWVKPVTGPSEQLDGKTPAELKQELEAEEKAELGRIRKKRGMKYPPEPKHAVAGDLLDQLRNGQRSAEDSQSLVTTGFPPTKGSDFCVVSAPRARADWYARAMTLCAQFRIGVAMVSEAHWEQIWLWVWKRNVDRMVKEKKTLLVLTQLERYGAVDDKPGLGHIDASQSVHVLYLQEQGYDFVAVDIIHFCRDLQPVLSAAGDDDFDTVETLLLSRRDIPVPVAGAVDTNFQSALHWAAVLGASDRVVRMLVEAGEDINTRQWLCDAEHPGWTPLHYAAKYGAPRVVRLLFELRADAHETNAADKSPLDLARGRFEVERMISQCHWRYCVACNADPDHKNEKPPDDAPAPVRVDGRKIAAVHVQNCIVCSRFS